MRPRCNSCCNAARFCAQVLSEPRGTVGILLHSALPAVQSATEYEMPLHVSTHRPVDSPIAGHQQNTFRHERNPLLFRLSQLEMQETGLYWNAVGFIRPSFL